MQLVHYYYYIGDQLEFLLNSLSLFGTSTSSDGGDSSSTHTDTGNRSPGYH